MGYDLTLVVARQGYSSPEHLKTKERYEDNSGFKYATDAKGDFIPTGRTECYCDVIVAVEVGRVGRILERLNAESAPELAGPVYFFFPPGGDGDNETRKDKYNEYLRAHPLPAAIDALFQAATATEFAPSWRVRVALDTLKACHAADSGQDLIVLFFGH